MGDASNRDEPRAVDDRTHDASIGSAPTAAPVGAQTTLAPVTVHDGGELEVTDEQPARYRSAPGKRSVIGQGGMGRVLLVVDEHLGREIALKELNAALEPASASIATSAAKIRFVREARVTGQLEHPNIVPVHELGRRDDGTLYYTMKVVRGRTLGVALKACTGLGDRLALLGKFRSVCDAIAYAHSRGAIHRDLKPSNVMVGEFGETVVVDWGLAKVRGQEDVRGEDLEREAVRLGAEGGSAETLAGSAIGTPAYMSPEQARGEIDAIDERSDVWGLGAILFEILTGRPPFIGASALDIVQKVRDDDVPAVHALEPAAPGDLAAIADKALQRVPARRYQTAAELTDEIAAWQEGRQVGAYSYSSWELLRRFVEQNRAATVAASVVLVALVVGSVLVYRAYAQAETARAAEVVQRQRAQRQQRRAEEQRRQAQVNERAAQDALTEAFLEKSDRALANADPASAAIFAAAALVNDPNNPRGAHSAPLANPTDAERRRARERIARSLSRYDAGVAGRTFRHVASYRAPAAPGAGRPGIRALEPAPDGARVAFAMSDGRVGIIDARRPEAAPRLLDAKRTTRPKRGTHANIDWAPSGELLAAAGADGVDLLPVRGGAAVRLSTDAPAADVAFSPDGARVVAALTSGHLRIWSVADRRLLGDHLVDPAGISRVAWLADGRTIAFGGTMPHARLWDVASRRVVANVRTGHFISHIQPVPGQPEAAFSSGDEHVYFVRRGQAGARRFEEPGRAGTLGFPAGGAWFVNAADLRPPRASVRDARTMAIRERLLGPARYATVARGDRVVFLAGGNTIRRFERADSRLRTVVAKHKSAAPLFFASADGRLVYSADISNTVLLTRTTRGSDGRLVPTSSTVLRLSGNGLVASSDGRFLALRPKAGATATVVRVSDGATVRVLRHGVPVFPPGAPSGTAFSPDGRQLLMGRADGAIVRFDLASGRALKPLIAHRRRVTAIRLSRRGDQMATASLDGTVRLWSWGADVPRRVLRGPGGLMMGLAFSTDGKRLATSGYDPEVRIWDTASGELVRRFIGHSQWVNDVDLSSDGRWLATASDDRTARVWETRTGRVLRIYARKEQVSQVRFSRDGRHVMIAAGLEIVRYRMTAGADDKDAAQLLAAAERAAGVKLHGLAVVPIDSTSGAHTKAR